MYKLVSKVVITTDTGKEYLFKGVVEAETVSTWDALTDTCTITVPRTIKMKDEVTGELKPIATSTNPIFKLGNKIEVYFGYDKTLNRWFLGYISKIYASPTVKIECQDAMYFLKQNNSSVSYRKTTLSQILRDIMPKNIPFEVAQDFEIGTFRASQQTTAQILNTLREEYFVRSFFRNGTLYTGLAIIPQLQKTHKLKYIIDNNLEYIIENNVRIKIKAVIMQPDNTKIEFEYGDKNGEVRTLHRYGIAENEMREICAKEIKMLKYTGFKGSFTTFLLPNIEHGDIVILPEDLKEIDKTANGKYIVKKVTKYFKGIQARQEIELERRVS